MALTELLFDIRQAEIGVLTLDASVKEAHKISAKATRHPVEVSEGGASGAVSDHFSVDPLSLQIEGVITNTPAEFAFTVANLMKGGAKDRVKEAFEELANTVLLGKLVTIATSLAIYPNMQLEAVEVTREASKGNALYFSATATQIHLVTLEEIALAPRPVDMSTKNAGKKGKKAASAVNASKSTSAAFKFFFGK